MSAPCYKGRQHAQQQQITYLAEDTSSVHLVRGAIALQVAKVEAREVGTAELHHVSSFWVGLLHELLKLGLAKQQERQQPDSAPIVQLTMDGVQELEDLAKTEARQAQHGSMCAMEFTTLRTTRMSCGKTLVQSLMQPFKEKSKESWRVDLQVGIPLLGRLCVFTVPY